MLTGRKEIGHRERGNSETPPALAIQSHWRLDGESDREHNGAQVQMRLEPYNQAPRMSPISVNTRLDLASIRR